MIVIGLGFGFFFDINLGFGNICYNDVGIFRVRF